MAWMQQDAKTVSVASGIFNNIVGTLISQRLGFLSETSGSDEAVLH